MILSIVMTKAGVNQIEEYSIATATELGMEDQASAFRYRASDPDSY